MNLCPRTGQPCSYPKAFTVTEITQHGFKNMQCCQKCVIAQPGMVALPVLPSPMGILQQILGGAAAFPLPLLQQQMVTPPQVEQPKCSGCGMTPVDIENVGRFGCPYCYQSFNKDIEDMLQRIHGGIKHVGKVPKAWKARQEAEEAAEKTKSVDRGVATVKKHATIPLEERIAVLEAKMKKHVAKEEYEKAAIIRDVIKQFKQTSSPTVSETPPSPSETPSTEPEAPETTGEES